ncbi:MAG: hypothetical protein CM15mV50_360 [uncultured marine virus]|nr:MAG: hypothetical protein CM15mV50_360 [uncultured marine virus]
MNSSGYNLVVGNGVSGVNKGITIFSNSDSSGSLHFADGTTGADAYRGIITYAHASNYMRIFTDATERMRIDSSGRVGINRTPAIANAKLEVGGADNVPLINVEASGNTAGIGIGSSEMKFSWHIKGWVSLQQEG